MNSNSWYVETLLRNRDTIRSSIVSYEQSYADTIVDTDLEDDDYNDLLIVEKTLRDLLNNSQLSEKEAIIISRVLEGKSLSKISRETGINRVVLVKFFQKVCDRVAFILGGTFTNEGYLEMLAKKHHLTEEQVEKARKYMFSNKRYNILRRVND